MIILYSSKSSDDDQKKVAVFEMINDNFLKIQREFECDAEILDVVHYFDDFSSILYLYAENKIW